MTDLSAIPYWSYSLLTAFERCGWQTLQTRIQKNVKEAEGKALIYGKAVHKSIEEVFKLKRGVPMEHAHIVPKIQPFVEMQGAPGIVFEAEVQTCLTPQLTPTEWFSRDKGDKRSWLRVATDLLVTDGTGIGVVVDWKTGKVQGDVREQLRLNALALFLTRPELKELSLSAVWLDQKDDATSAYVKREEAMEIWDQFCIRLRPMARAFEKGDFRKVPGWQCRYCPVLTCELRPK